MSRSLLALTVIAGCASSPPAPRPAVALPEPDPALREVTRDAVHTAERRGFTLERVGEPRFAVEARAHVEAVVVPAESCRLFVLVGASGVAQASAALYFPDGRRVARDLGPQGMPPAVGACGGAAPLTLYWHSSVRGAGLVRGLEFSNDAIAGSRAGLVRLQDGVGELALALQRRGFVHRGEPRVLSLAAGEEGRFPVVLGARRCLALVVRGLPATLRLVEGDELVARDGAGGEQAVQLCAEGADRRLVAVVRAAAAGEAEVHRYDIDRRSLGGDAALWLGERAPAVSEPIEEPEGRMFRFGPAEVAELPLPETEGCTWVRARSGEGSQGVWLEDPTETRRSLERCVDGPRVRFGSVGGGRVWVDLGARAAAPNPRPPAPRGARR